MSDSGLRYWLSWPHTRQDHLIVFAVFFAITLAGGYFEEPAVALLSALMTVLVGVRLMAWNAEEAAAGETEDAPLKELLGMGGSWDRGDGPSGDDGAAGLDSPGRREPDDGRGAGVPERDTAGRAGDVDGESGDGERESERA